MLGSGALGQLALGQPDDQPATSPVSAEAEFIWDKTAHAEFEWCEGVQLEMEFDE